MVKSELTLDSVVTRSTGVMGAPLAGDFVILNPAGDNYLGLDEMGRRVWELLAGPTKVRDVCMQITREFSGEPERIAADILHFLQELAAEGLLYVAKA